MTQAAREVLEDCRLAASRLRDGIAGREWRIAWITAVTLLRAVGHVLRNVDAKLDTRFGAAVDASWRSITASKPEPKIFWEFIEKERNAVQKEYRPHAGLAISLRPGMAHVDRRTGNQTGEPGMPTVYNYHMRSGVYAGIDQRELLAEAIAWWDEYLTSIERQVDGNTWEESRGADC